MMMLAKRKRPQRAPPNGSVTTKHSRGCVPFLCFAVLAVLLTGWSIQVSMNVTSLTTGDGASVVAREGKTTKTSELMIAPHGDGDVAKAMEAPTDNKVSLKGYFCAACPDFCSNQIMTNFPFGEDLALQYKQFVDAQAEISLQGLCKPCDRSICPSGLDLHAGYNEAAPKVYGGVTPFLKSIPSNEYRIPFELAADPVKKQEFLAAPAGDELKSGKRYFLHTFNPSIIPIPDSLREQIHGGVYLTSFRVSPHSSCVSFNLLEAIPYGEHEYMGLAVMDKDLNILKEGVFHVNSLQQNKPMFEDNRLFYLDDGKLYISFSFLLLPIVVSTEKSDVDDAVYLPQVFGKDELHVQALSAKPRFTWGLLQGANFQFFKDKFGKGMLEEWVEKPRTVRNYTIEGNLRTTDVFESQELPAMAFVGHDKVLPYAWKVRDRARGSACCIKLPRKYYEDLIELVTESSLNNSTPSWVVEQEYLLVGIAHVRSLAIPVDGMWNAYITRMYAFIPEAPFSLVGRSGHFCFGFTPATEETEDPFAHPKSVAVQPRLLYKNQTYECPHINYVSGMTEMADDESKVIIAYGVNDCSPRMVIVEKRALAVRLFLPLFGKAGLETLRETMRKAPNVATPGE